MYYFFIACPSYSYIGFPPVYDNLLYSSSKTASSHSLLVSSPATSIARCENQESGAAPCQCFTFAGMLITVPGVMLLDHRFLVRNLPGIVNKHRFQGAVSAFGCCVHQLLLNSRDEEFCYQFVRGFCFIEILIKATLVLIQHFNNVFPLRSENPVFRHKFSPLYRIIRGIICQKSPT